MSAALSALDVPRRWAESKIKKKKEVQDRQDEKPMDSSVSGLRAVMGMAKGVGAVDLMAFLIALFSVKEEYLIGLLNEKQFSNMKKEYPTGFFDNFDREGITISAAVDEIASIAYDSYQIFRFALKAPRREPPPPVSEGEASDD